MALTWIEVKQLEELMQPGGSVESGIAALFPLRPAWQADGACREPHPEASWFPERGHAAGAQLAAARAVCSTCPAREPCRAYAMANPELVGVWAGTTRRERRLARRSQ